MNLQPVRRIKGRICAIESRIRALSGDEFTGDSFRSSLNHVRNISKSQLLSKKIDQPPTKADKTLNPKTFAPDDPGSSRSLPSKKTVIEKRDPVPTKPPATKDPLDDLDEKSLARIIRDGEFDDSLKLVALSALKVRNATTAEDPLLKTSRANPKKIIKFDGFSMQARAAVKYRKLKVMIQKRFPGRGVYVTSTMEAVTRPLPTLQAGPSTL